MLETRIQANGTVVKQVLLKPLIMCIFLMLLQEIFNFKMFTFYSHLPD